MMVSAGDQGENVWGVFKLVIISVITTVMIVWGSDCQSRSVVDCNM